MKYELNRNVGRLLRSILLSSDAVINAWMMTQRRIVLLRQRLLYRERPDDVFIVSYPKSGTTWMQMIVYQLLKDRDMNIPHIETVIPHLEEDMTLMHADLEGLPNPRILKSHLRYGEIPKGCGRYIYAMRDGLDVMVSFYYHYRRAFGYVGDLDSFSKLFMKGEVVYGGWFSHVNEWTSNAYGLTVLIVRYEDLSRDLAGQVRRIAQFCSQPLDEPVLTRVLENSSFEVMRKHEMKFDNMARKRAATKVKEEDNHFIRKGRVGGWRDEVGPELRRAYFDAIDSQLRGDVFDEYRHPHDRGVTREGGGKGEYV